MSALDLTQLARFVAIAETGSFRRAADRLGISQPTLSWSIRQLETALGAEVIVRGARGATLTAIGTTLLPRARLMVSESARAIADVLEVKGQRDAVISVGVAPMFTNTIFPAASAATLARSPGLVLRVREDYSVALMAALQAGEIDMAFAGKPAEGDMSGLTFEPLHKQRYILAARSNHPIFAERRITDATILTYDCVMFDTVAPILTQAGLPSGAAQPNVRVTTSSIQYIKSMIMEAGFIGYLAYDYVRPEIEAGTLREVPNKTLAVTAAAGILLREDGAQTAAMRMLASELRAACGVTRRKQRS